MAGNPNTKNSTTIEPRLRIQYQGNVAIGPGKAELLEHVRETGSISEAARRMEMSYLRAWILIQTMNESFKEPVVAAVRGGAELTAIGCKVLKFYQQVEEKSRKAIESSWKELQLLLRG